MRRKIWVIEYAAATSTGPHGNPAKNAAVLVAH